MQLKLKLMDSRGNFIIKVDQPKAKLVVFYSRAGENYFGGQYRFAEVGNTEKTARMIGDTTGAELFKIEQRGPYSPNISAARKGRT